ncbi:transketolase [Lactococcus lactis]|uniref:transketolase n=1 Tax=Lactococcus lactis TaxID=1358 RepID=UPI0028BDE2F9|nr:transketolase [Lactococcus lactis]WNN67627.1 transketolase [Lactococcus lactis]WPK09626.1 transketolase [Lactococcus lactis]
MEVIQLKKKAIEIRKEVLKMIDRSRTGHTSSDLSCTDILVALYYGVMNVNPKDSKMDNRDQYVQSKGHAVEALWAVLADKGFFPKEELKTYSQFGTRLIGHPNNKVEGIEMNTGSLGHGLPVSVGIALAGKMDKDNYHTYTLLGDGELAEGSVWEGAMAAANFKLDNLTAIIDRNKLQITGSSESVMAVENLKAKWEAFGWEVHEIPGNDIERLVETLTAPNKVGRPKMVIALTTKGKGVSFMENQAVWHHKVPAPDEYEQAMKELDEQLEELNNA